MIKIRNIICIITLATFITGCATTMKTPFDDSAFQPFVGNGTSTITGQAFEKTNGGDVKFGAGDEVSLIPVTPYTTEMTSAWHNKSLFVALPQPPQTDPQLQKYIRKTIGDGNGNFEFHKIPSGDYYIVCPIFWKVPDAISGILVDTGEVAYTKIHIDNGEAVKVVVTSQ